MKRSAALIVVAILSLSSMAGCQFLGGDTVLSEDEWATTRQQQIDLVTDVARETSTDAYVVQEGIGACETGDDLDRTIGSSDYYITARPTEQTKEHLDRIVRPRLEADGWTFRDRTAEPNQPEGTTLDYYWTKGDANFSVDISPGGDGRPVIQVGASSACGKLGDITYGDVQPDDPWFLAPTVDGPTIADNRRTQ